MEPCTQDYPPNLAAWLISGPFDLRGAKAAEVRFELWQRLAVDGDIFGYVASADRSDWWGWQKMGGSGDWQDISFDLSQVPSLGDLRGGVAGVGCLAP